MLIDVEPLLAHALPLLIVMSRLGGLMMTAPLFSSGWIPRRVKGLLLLTMAASVYPALDIAGGVRLSRDINLLAPIVAMEMAIGAAIGLMATLPLHAIQLGGLMMGQQMGLGIAAIVDPTSDITGDGIARMFYLLAMMSFIVVGGLELMVGATIESFARVPFGGFRVDSSFMEMFTGLMDASLVVAFRVSLPVVVIIFLENIVIGFLMRTIPGLNILNFGFPMRILLGLMAVVGSHAFIRTVTTADMDRTADVITNWVQELGPSVHEPSGGADG